MMMMMRKGADVKYESEIMMPHCLSIVSGEHEAFDEKHSDSTRDRLRLGVKPVIENSITNIFSQFDANVTIPCTVRQGYPVPVIYW